MIGVILWSDEVERKAVVWCEDQGDLAFLDNSASLQGAVFAVGDVVSFDLSVQTNLRRAHNAVIAKDPMTESHTPDQIPADRAVQGAKIIPFEPVRTPGHTTHKRNAHGA